MWLIEAVRRMRRESGVVKCIQQLDYYNILCVCTIMLKVYTGRAQVLCAQRKAGGRADGGFDDWLTAHDLPPLGFYTSPRCE